MFFARKKRHLTGTSIRIWYFYDVLFYMKQRQKNHEDLCSNELCTCVNMDIGPKKGSLISF